MKLPRSWPLRLTTLLAGLLLLSSCAPTPGIAPSGALREQLQEIRRQQQEQAEQLRLMQQQVAQLEKSLGIDGIALLPPPLPPEAPPAEPAPVPMELIHAQQEPAVSAYLAAFSSLASGRPDAAETGFERFLQEFPDHRQAPNARFWLASAQRSLGKTDLAASNLRRIIIDPNAQSKAPAALLQLAQIYRQQGFTTQAEEIFEQLRGSYPDSPEAQQLLRSKAPSTQGEAAPRQRGNQ